MNQDMQKCRLCCSLTGKKKDICYMMAQVLRARHARKLHSKSTIQFMQFLSMCNIDLENKQQTMHQKPKKALIYISNFISQILHRNNGGKIHNSNQTNIEVCTLRKANKKLSLTSLSPLSSIDRSNLENFNRLFGYFG